MMMLVCFLWLVIWVMRLKVFSILVIGFFVLVLIVVSMGML